jgi:predicted nucleic acid-binding protein
VYLVDTSVFTRLWRTEVADAIEEFVPHGIHFSAITGLEVRFSASNETEWDLLDQAFAEYRRENVSAADLDRADAVQRLLACRALKGRKPADLIIAAQAERLGLTVLHYDKDFELIASVTDQRHLWIVERGTID